MTQPQARLSDERLATIQALRAAITAAKWDDPYLISRGYWLVDTVDDLETIARVPEEADARFIAAAPGIVDDLLAERTALLAQVDQLFKLLGVGTNVDKC